jgi:CHAT domain-containing protein/tetratricopeptide (TPR) repeat protein
MRILLLILALKQEPSGDPIEALQKMIDALNRDDISALARQMKTDRALLPGAVNFLILNHVLNKAQGAAQKIDKLMKFFEVAGSLDLTDAEKKLLSSEKTRIETVDGFTQEQAKDYATVFNLIRMIRSGQYRGKPKDMEQDLDAAVVLADSLKDPWLRCYAVSQRASFEMHVGKLEEGAQDLKAAVELSRERGDRASEAASTTSLGAAYSKLGKLDEALGCHKRAIELTRELKDRLSEAVALDNAGVVLSKLGRNEESLQFKLGALKIFRDIGNKAEEAVTLGNIGETYKDLGRYTEATQYLEEGLQWAKGAPNASMEGILRDNLGTVCRRTGRPEEALRNHVRAIAIFKEVGAKGEEAVAHSNLAGTYRALAQYADAAAEYEKAAELYKELGLSSMQAEILGEIGDMELDRGQTVNALRRFEAADELLQKSGDPAGRVELQIRIGKGKVRTGAYAEAADCFRKSVDLARRCGYVRGEACALDQWGDLNLDLMLLEQAQEFYLHALELFKKNEDQESQGDLLCSIGHVLREQGRYEEAQKYYQEAIDLSRRTGSRFIESKALAGLGITFSKMALLDQALAYHLKCLKVEQELGARANQGTTMSNIGVVYSKAGKYREAFKYLEDAVRLDLETGNKQNESSARTHLGNLYLMLEDGDKALQELEKALDLTRETRDLAGESVTLTSLGSAYAGAGQSTKAIECYEAALRLLKGTGLKEYQATLLNNIANTFIDAGRTDDAIQSLQEALKLDREIGARKSEALTLGNIGSVYFARGQLDEAEKHAIEAAKIQAELGDRYHESGALFDLGILYWSKKDYESMAAVMERSVQAAESVRASLGMLAGEKLSWMKRSRVKYEFAALAAQRLGKDDTAFGYLERVRSRNLLDSVASNDSISAELQSKREQAVGRYNMVQMKLQALSRQSDLAKTDDEKAKLKPSIERAREELARAEEELLKAAREMEVQQSAEEIRPVSLKEVQAALNEDEAFVFYHDAEFSGFGAKASGPMILVGLITRSTFRLDTVQKHEEFTQDVQSMRLTAALTVKNVPIESYRKRAHRLYRTLLAPLEQDLKSVKRLIVSPDAMLYAVPFEALVASDGGRAYADLDYVSRRFEIQTAYSATLLARQRNEKRVFDRKFVGFGDPDYPSEAVAARRGAESGGRKLNVPEDLKPFLGPLPGTREQEREGTWDKLPYSRPEVEESARQFKESEIHLDKDASERGVRSVTGARILHFACHGVLDPQEPMRSGLMLTADKEFDGRLEAREIAALKLPVELVVLSACNSAQGEILAGEGLIGLTRAFMIAGARSVIASLWTVSDEGGKEFMIAFYKRLAGGMDKARALAETKREFMRHEKYSAPYYWAGFVLHGD